MDRPDISLAGFKRYLRKCKQCDYEFDNYISGFDYRYFKESVGLRITKEFISRAKSIGRYDK